MQLSNDITLDRSQVPIFPDRCVRCRVDQPGTTLTVATHTVGWWTWALWVAPSRFAVEVPVCPCCRRAMLRQRWFRRCLFAACLAIAIAVFMWLLGWYRGPFRRWLAFGVVMLLMLPYFAWEMLFPPPFDMTATRGEVDYEFQDGLYALEFAGLNTWDDEEFEDAADSDEQDRWDEEQQDDDWDDRRDDE